MRRHHISDPVLTIKTITHLGRTVDLNVSDKGIFYAMLNEEKIEAKSLDSLADRVKTAIARAGDLAIPVTILTCRYSDDKPTFQDVDLVGQHGRSRQPKVRDAEGREDTTYDKVCRRLTKPEKERIVHEWQQQAHAQKAYDKLVEDAELDVPAALAAEAVRLDARASAAVEAAQVDEDPRTAG